MPACSKAKNPQGIEIIFTENDHRYTSIIDGKEIVYVSGTTFLGKYFPMFSTRTEYRACVMYKLLEVLYFELTAISAAREISCG